ncbi:MAG TPA: 1-deoxy-D-xylulose-5-phosphate reductoisomerase [Acidobacteriota bacterium]|nr:1-deoxy-D-xylulose-5-phosphate reductoisomerase [Acidobacteriota bacterium]
MKRVSILGSTGSIGQSALSLVDLHPDKFEVVALAAGKNTELLIAQCRRYRPSLAAIEDETAAARLREATENVDVEAGLSGIIAAACHPDADIVVSAITGAAGLVPTYHAIRHGKDIALANKESLVTAGELLIPLAREGGSRLLPVDSEHSALHQCLSGISMNHVRRLILTASGGPFFGKSAEELDKVTVEQALDHPTWQMGKKITVDSATLMNKGLEVIEAHHLFQVPPQQIQVIIHPQSIVHSLVEVVDGTILAQLSIADMRLAIFYALSYPERLDARLPSLDLFQCGPLEFHPPDFLLFPCLRLAFEALEAGKSYPAALNAANEVAVSAFLEGRLAFVDIARVIERVLDQHQPVPIDSIDTVLEVDRQARRTASDLVQQQSAPSSRSLW